MSQNKYREEEQIAIDRAQEAFNRRQRALIDVHRQFSPFGNGSPTEESLTELEQAEEELLAADVEVKRIVYEFRRGTRG